MENEEVIQHYVDRNGVIKDTDFMIDQINKVDQAFQKLSSVSVSFPEIKGAKDLAALTKEAEEGQKRLEKATKDLLTTQKLMAEVKAKEAKASREQAQTDAIRTKSLIDQEKELDRLIAKEEKLSKQRKSSDFSTGSQADIRQQRSELNALLIKRTEGESINFRGQLLSYDEAKKKLQELNFAEQDFRRQFQKDGTLVGEYAAGIVNAFDRLKIGDILKDDIGRGKQQLSQLEKKTNELVVAYRKAKAEGSEDFEKLRKEIHDNVMESESLRRNIQANETQLASMGNVGSKITNTIKEQFKGLKTSISQFVLGYFGFQAALSGGKKLININFGFEDSVNELKAITGVAGKDLDFLKKQALDTSSKTKFSAIEILESFKLIASAKPELLENVEALNKIKDAAIILAQASGQTLPEAVDSLTKVLNQFGADASKSAE